MRSESIHIIYSANEEEDGEMDAFDDDSIDEGIEDIDDGGLLG